MSEEVLKRVARLRALRRRTPVLPSVRCARLPLRFLKTHQRPSSGPGNGVLTRLLSFRPSAGSCRHGFRSRAIKRPDGSRRVKQCPPFGRTTQPQSLRARAHAYCVHVTGTDRRASWARGPIRLTACSAISFLKGTSFPGDAGRRRRTLNTAGEAGGMSAAPSERD